MRFVLLLAALMLSAATPPAVGQIAQFPDPANAPTCAPYAESYANLLVEEHLEAYYARGDDDPKWDAHVERVIRITASRSVYGIMGGAESHRALREAVTAALDAGCEYPELLYQAHRMAPKSTPQEQLERARLINTAAMGIEGKPFPPLRRFRVYELQAYECLDTFPGMARMLFAKALRSLDEAAKAGELLPETPTSQRRLYAVATFNIRQKADPQWSESFYNSLISIEGLDPWTRHMLDALRSVELAWRARGTKTVDKTEEEQFAGFERHLRAARRSAISAHRLHPQRPEAASLLIKIDMGIPEETQKNFHYWFEQAIAAEIDWPPAYYNYEWALRPRWYGSHEMMLQLADAAWNTRRFDTSLPICRIWMVANVGRDIKDHKPVWDVPLLYNAGIATIDALIERPEWEARSRYLHTLRAAVAYWGANDEDFKASWRHLAPQDDPLALDRDALSVVAASDAALREHAASLGL